MLIDRLEKANLYYPVSLLMTKDRVKNFSRIAEETDVSADTIRRSLQDAAINREWLMQQIIEECKNVKRVHLLIDGTLINKQYSQFIEGTGWHYNTKLHKRQVSYKGLVSAIYVNNKTLPIDINFLWSREYTHLQKFSKDEIIKNMIMTTKEKLSHLKLCVVMDGEFATKNILQWALDNKIDVELRMHSNRKVMYKGKLQIIRDIPTLQLKGNRFARTIQVKWHNMLLFITAQRRSDKDGCETTVYLVSTYVAIPMNHVATYKIRWHIEEMFRTCKQSLGLTSCQSTKKQTQLNHVTSVLVAYALLQLHYKKWKYKTPEDALRLYQLKNRSC